MESISLASLAALQALMRTGSLAGAARELHLTGPAVHKQLKLLESALGIRLYEKAGRGLRLNGAARHVFPYVQAALAQISAAGRAAEEWRGLRAGQVRIGSGATLSTHWLPRILSRFRAAHPEVEVTIDTGSTIELCEQLQAGFIDIAFVLEEKAQRQSALKPIARWASRAFLVTGDEAMRHTRRLPQLAQAPFLGYRSGTRFASYTERFFQRHRFSPAWIARCDNPDSMFQMLGAGFGYSILPEWVLTRPPLLGQVWILPLREKLPDFHVELLSSAAFPLNPAAVAFAAVARKEALPTLSPLIASAA